MHERTHLQRVPVGLLHQPEGDDFITLTIHGEKYLLDRTTASYLRERLDAKLSMMD